MLNPPGHRDATGSFEEVAGSAEDLVWCGVQHGFPEAFTASALATANWAPLRDLGPSSKGSSPAQCAERQSGHRRGRSGCPWTQTSCASLHAASSECAAQSRDLLSFVAAALCSPVVGCSEGCWLVCGHSVCAMVFGSSGQSGCPSRQCRSCISRRGFRAGFKCIPAVAPAFCCRRLLHTNHQVPVAACVGGTSAALRLCRYARYL